MNEKEKKKPSFPRVLFAVRIDEEHSALVLTPRGHCSLHSISVPNDNSRVEHCFNIRRWLYQAYQQLCSLHKIKLGHGDVKPSNIVLRDRNPSRPSSNRREWVAMLIDFEHCAVLGTTRLVTFSGTERYASRRILSVTNGLGRTQVESFTYTAMDDIESLFFSAFEVLRQSRTLPWCKQNLEIDEALRHRHSLFESDKEWCKYRSEFDDDSWEWLSAARKNLHRMAGQFSDVFRYISVFLCLSLSLLLMMLEIPTVLINWPSHSEPEKRLLLDRNASQNGSYVTVGSTLRSPRRLIHSTDQAACLLWGCTGVDSHVAASTDDEF